MKFTAKNKRKCYCGKIVKGFETLKQYYGPFEASIDMVWVDKGNNVKVWLNSNPFYNSFKKVKEELMVLQINAILLQLECDCSL